MNWVWIAVAVGVVLVLTVVVLGGLGVLVAVMGKGQSKPRKVAAKVATAATSVLDDVENSPFVELAEGRRKELIHGACRQAVDGVVKQLHPALEAKAEPKAPEAKP